MRSHTVSGHQLMRDTTVRPPVTWRTCHQPAPMPSRKVQYKALEPVGKIILAAVRSKHQCAPEEFNRARSCNKKPSDGCYSFLVANLVIDQGAIRQTIAAVTVHPNENPRVAAFLKQLPHFEPHVPAPNARLAFLASGDTHSRLRPNEVLIGVVPIRDVYEDEGGLYIDHKEFLSCPCDPERSVCWLWHQGQQRCVENPSMAAYRSQCPILTVENTQKFAQGFFKGYGADLGNWLATPSRRRLGAGVFEADADRSEMWRGCLPGPMVAALDRLIAERGIQAVPPCPASAVGSTDLEAWDDSADYMPQVKLSSFVLLPVVRHLSVRQQPGMQYANQLLQALQNPPAAAPAVAVAPAAPLVEEAPAAPIVEAVAAAEAPVADQELLVAAVENINVDQEALAAALEDADLDFSLDYDEDMLLSE